MDHNNRKTGTSRSPLVVTYLSSYSIVGATMLRKADKLEPTARGPAASSGGWHNCYYPEHGSARLGYFPTAKESQIWLQNSSKPGRPSACELDPDVKVGGNSASSERLAGDCPACKLEQRAFHVAINLAPIKTEAPPYSLKFVER